jgi:hypothetical protein
LIRGLGFGRGFGFALVFAETVVVAFTVLFRVDVGATETFTVGFAVVFAVGDGVGLFVAASAVVPDIASANTRKSAAFFNRAPT